MAGAFWATSRMWLPMLFTLIVRSLLLKFWGLKGYRRAIPFFVGLIAGEFGVAFLFSLLSFFANMPKQCEIAGL